MREEEPTGMFLITYSKIGLQIALFQESQEAEPPLNHSTFLPQALRKHLLMHSWEPGCGLVEDSIRELWFAGRRTGQRLFPLP